MRVSIARFARAPRDRQRSSYRRRLAARGKTSRTAAHSCDVEHDRRRGAIELVAELPPNARYFFEDVIDDLKGR